MFCLNTCTFIYLFILTKRNIVSFHNGFEDQCINKAAFPQRKKKKTEKLRKGGDQQRGRSARIRFEEESTKRGKVVINDNEIFVNIPLEIYCDLLLHDLNFYPY